MPTMEEIPVTIDPDRLRAVANRVEQSADTVGRFRGAGLPAAALPGSTLATATDPAITAALLDPLLDRLRAWAQLARLAAATVERADEEAGSALEPR